MSREGFNNEENYYPEPQGNVTLEANCVCENCLIGCYRDCAVCVAVDEVVTGVWIDRPPALAEAV